MKKIILLCLCISIEIFSQTISSVELSKTYCDWGGSNKAFDDSVETILRDMNGNVIQPSNAYYYEYHVVTNGNLDIIGGAGKNTEGEDNDKNLIQTWYVLVTDPSNNKTYQSNQVTFQMETEDNFAKEVIFSAINSNGSTETGVHKDHWMYVVDLWHFSDDSPYLTVDMSEVLRSSPFFLTSNNDKFQYWNDIRLLSLNHNHFYYEDNNSAVVTAHYDNSNDGVTIQNNLEGFTGDTIRFKDPWLVDHTDFYGTRNQGMGAPLKKLPSPFHPSIESQYNGVFLGQEIAPDKTYYSVQAISPRDVDFGGVIGTRTLYFVNWSGTEVEFDEPFNMTTGVMFKDDDPYKDPIINANFKTRGLSDNQYGFSSGSQRKFVKTGDGSLHYVYSDFGRVWYERSTDNGATWEIANDGNPLDWGNAKLPSIDQSGQITGDEVLIVYQEKFGDNSIIKVKRYQGGVLVDSLYTNEITQNYDQSDLNPVIALSKNTPNYKFIVVYQTVSGLYYKFGYQDYQNPGGALLWYPWSDVLPLPYGIVRGTDQNSTNPTIVAQKTLQSDGNFYLAWQQYDNQIYYLPVHYSGDIVFYNNQDPILYSENSGFTNNYSPSISIAGSANSPVISWVGHNGTQTAKMIEKETGGSVPENITQVVTKRGTDGNYFVGGNNVNNVNNNSSRETAENSVIIWSEGNPAVSKWVKRARTNYGDIEDLHNSGINTQVSNGIGLSSIKAMVYNINSVPYYFSIDDDDFSLEVEPPGTGKITDGLYLTYGRSGIVGKNGVQFVFNIGDIVLADTNVKFIPRPDTILYSSPEELNQVTRSLTFHLDNQSQLYFTNFYYTVNSDIADSVLSEDEQVTFRAELVDVNTNSVFGTFDEITYTIYNLEEYDNINYQVDCSEIQAGDYYLRLVTEVEGPAAYNLANVQNDSPELEKRDYANVNFAGNKTPISYDLSQNFPNPFNPATTIIYQLPQTGFVTLKIYDILGKEVATLVNEQKNQGRYSVNFSAAGGSAYGGDASKLASGVYIYQLRVNNYVSSKKMLLLK